MKNYIYTLLAATFILAPISAMEKRPADAELSKKVTKKVRVAAHAKPSYLEILPIDIKNMLGEHTEAHKILIHGLAHASETGDIENIQFMLKHFPKTNLDRLDKEGFSPLIRATIAGNTDIASLLLKSEANPYFRALSGATPLWFCAHYNRPQIAELVLQKIYQTPMNKRIINSDVKYTGTYNGMTPLAEAVIQNYPQMVRVLLDAGFDPNTIIDTGSWQVKNKSCLIHAAQMGYDEIIDMLINADAQVNFKNATVTQRFTNDIQAHKADMTALMYAADHGHIGAVARLLQARGINVCAKNAEGKTALDLAIASTSRNKNEIIKLLQNHVNKKK